MSIWVKLGLTGALLAGGVAVAASVAEESECDRIQAAYAEGLKLGDQVAYGTHGSVVIAADGTKEMVLMYREARQLGCEGFDDPAR